MLASRVSNGGLGACGGGPLPWLPEVPSALRASPGANDYLERLTGRIEELSDRVVEEASGPGLRESAAWTRALNPDADHQLVGDLAVWRAAHAAPVTEARPKGRPLNASAAAKHRSRLDRRLTSVGEEAFPSEVVLSERLLGDRARSVQQHTHRTGRSSHSVAPRR